VHGLHRRPVLSGHRGRAREYVHRLCSRHIFPGRLDSVLDMHWGVVRSVTRICPVLRVCRGHGVGVRLVGVHDLPSGVLLGWQCGSLLGLQSRHVPVGHENIGLRRLRRWTVFRGDGDGLHRLRRWHFSVIVRSTELCHVSLGYVHFEFWGDVVVELFELRRRQLFARLGQCVLKLRRRNVPAELGSKRVF
jgi:hypothetical protein